MFDARIREAFPNGMQKWDMVYNKNGKGYIVKGTGVADLGSLSWNDDTFNGVPTFTTKDVTNGVMRSVYGSLGDSIIALYSEMIEFGHLATSDNKVFVFNSSAHAPNTLAVRDTAYTNASEFKSAMNGVMLYYQLAEPTIIEYDEPFNFSYRIADFGTEEIISNTLSAPLRTKIEYGFNAYDTIITNKLSIRELLTKTNYAIKNLSIGNDVQNKINIFQDGESNELFIQTLEGVVISTRDSTTTISDTGIVTNGSVSATNGFFQTSDANLKNFSDPISVDLEKLSTLKKHYFTWKNGGDQQIGVCAQEIQELYPEIVNQANDGTLSVCGKRETAEGESAGHFPQSAGSVHFQTICYGFRCRRYAGHLCLHGADRFGTISELLLYYHGAQNDAGRAAQRLHGRSGQQAGHGEQRSKLPGSGKDQSSFPLGARCEQFHAAVSVSAVYSCLDGQRKYACHRAGILFCRLLLLHGRQ